MIYLSLTELYRICSGIIIDNGIPSCRPDGLSVPASGCRREEGQNMIIRETTPDTDTINTLIALSKDWAAENSCTGYRENEVSDIEGNRIFLAEEDGSVIGYLFGKLARSEKQTSVMPDNTPFFEVAELYVVPSQRSKGVGSALFHYAENAVRSEAQFILLSTATKNWKAILHFYLEELGMTFWSATLYRRLS